MFVHIDGWNKRCFLLKLIYSRIGMQNKLCDFVRRRSGRRSDSERCGIDSLRPRRPRRRRTAFKSHAEKLCAYRDKGDRVFRRSASTKSNDLPEILSVITGFQSLLRSSHSVHERFNEPRISCHIRDCLHTMWRSIFKLDPGDGTRIGNWDFCCVFQIPVA